MCVWGVIAVVMLTTTVLSWPRVTPYDAVCLVLQIICTLAECCKPVSFTIASRTDSCQRQQCVRIHNNAAQIDRTLIRTRRLVGELVTVTPVAGCVQAECHLAVK